MLAVLRSTLFAAFLALITPPFTAVALATFPLPALTRYRVITLWSRCVVWAARVLCGIRYRVLGARHLPRRPCIILSKHQSAWMIVCGGRPPALSVPLPLPVSTSTG